jgi:hypothetical protein
MGDFTILPVTPGTDKVYKPGRDGPKIPPSDGQEVGTTPETPEKRPTVISRKTKPASPDLIQFTERPADTGFMEKLILEDIGGIELLSISRNDIINGQRISYNIISNTTEIAKLYSPKKFVQSPGSSEENFRSFGIRFAPHVPDEGTGPLLNYVGAFNSVVGCDAYPILNKYTDELVGCATTFLGAQDLAQQLSPPKSVAYSEPLTGDIVIDVVNMLPNEKVDIEILQVGQLEDDTIY